MSRNELAAAVSPYLLQHANNPVHWRMWGPAALAEARREGKPVLLSIGYAACHWCHVMAHESFEDAATAALMNRLYVNIKVDREERPDLDRLYMGALNAMGEQGGWPLTMFLTPEGAPFWGGTYFPPEPRWGRPSFRQVLTSVRAAWDGQPDAIAANARAITTMLETMGKARPGAAIDPAALDRAGTYLAGLVDPDQGGLTGAPKFPNAPLFRFLWQEAYRRGDRHLAGLVARTLRRMCQGGIWDHLGGGLARYSTDAMWCVPHFEKMLSDNAQLLEQLAFVHAAAPDPLFVARADELVAWLEREMRAGPGYAASQDADSEGEEGRFYVWTAAEIDAALGPAAAPAFRAAYGVTDAGNWEGRSVLTRSPDLALKDPGDEATLAAAGARLFAIRARRVPPATDDKVLADWNGLTIAALARAATVFGRPAWRARAIAVFHALDTTLRDGEGRLGHAFRAGRLSATALLEDVAALARAALMLHEATGEEAFLARARAFVAEAEARFADADGAFFATAADAGDVPVRSRHAADDVTPSGIGMMAEVLARLWHLTGETGFRDRARRLLAAFAGAGDALAAMPGLLAAADLLEAGAVVVVAGPPGDPGAEALLAAALAAPDPAVVVARAGAGLAPDHPAYGKGMVDGAAAAYICRDGVCLPPVAEAGALRAALGRQA